MPLLPNLQEDSSAAAFPVTYNSSEAGERTEAAMSQSWKQLEGEVIDHQFPLRQYLGGSAGGAVFLTELGSAGQRAAIRLVPSGPEDSRQLALWEQAAKLEHPNLLRIYGCGQSEAAGISCLYVVLEYAEENLAQVLPQRALTAAETREMLRPLLDTLTFIHASGFVHGRLTPANIMAVADQLKLSSDSLCPAATIRKASASAYDPPDPGGAKTPAGDIWSLGVTLVEVLTLRRPVWKAVSGGELDLPEGIPQIFLEIVRKCLDLVPERRCTAAEIQLQLEPGASSRQAAPPPPVYRPPEPVRQAVPEKFLQPKIAASRPRYLIPLALGAFLLVALIGVRIYHSPPAAPYPAAQKAQAPLSGTNSETTAAAPQPQPKPAPALPAPALPAQAQPAAQAARPSPPAEQAARPAPAETPQPKPALQPVNKNLTAATTPSGSVLHEALPNVPQSARDTIEGHVRVSVKVSVDASGNVTAAELTSPGPSKYFARLAEQASRDWKFVPPEVNGQKAQSEWILHFAFGRENTDVHTESVAR